MPVTISVVSTTYCRPASHTHQSTRRDDYKETGETGRGGGRCRHRHADRHTHTYTQTYIHTDTHRHTDTHTHTNKHTHRHRHKGHRHTDTSDTPTLTSTKEAEGGNLSLGDATNKAHKRHRQSLLRLVGACACVRVCVNHHEKQTCKGDVGRQSDTDTYKGD